MNWLLVKKNLLAAESSSVPNTISHDTGVDESNYNTGHYGHYLGADFPDAETDMVRRTRSIEIKASTCEDGRVNHKLKLSKFERLAGTSKNSEDSSKDYMSRSSRRRHDIFDEDDQELPTTSQANGSIGNVGFCDSIKPKMLHMIVV